MQSTNSNILCLFVSILFQANCFISGLYAYMNFNFIGKITRLMFYKFLLVLLLVIYTM